MTEIKRVAFYVLAEDPEPRLIGLDRVRELGNNFPSALSGGRH